MSAEAELYAALTGASAVTALVSTRIYPDVIPEDQQVPAIAYARTGTEPINTIHGASVAEFANFEIACLAEQRDVADAIADAAKVALMAAQFLFVSRQQDFDNEQGLWSTGLSVRRFTTS